MSRKFLIYFHQIITFCHPHILLSKSDQTLVYKYDDDISFRPTPIPLSDSSQESPTDPTTAPDNFTISVTTFIPENHDQVPYFEGITPLSSVTSAVFVPSQLEHGFHPMIRSRDRPHYDVTNSRYDRDPGVYVDNPRGRYNHYEYKPIPLRRPSFTSRPIKWSPNSYSRDKYYSQSQYTDADSR